MKKDDEKNLIKERLNSKNELFFRGEAVADLMDEGIKLVTIRRDSENYHGFEVGQTLTASCEGRKVETIVWGIQENVKLNEVDPIVRGLDGFITLDHAVDGLGKIYKEKNPEMPVVVIATITKEKFDGLSDEQRKALLSQKEGKSLSEVVRDPRLADLIKFSLSNWVLIRGGTVNDWLTLYIESGLMSCEQYGAIVGYAKKAEIENKKNGDEDDLLHSVEYAEFVLRGILGAGWNPEGVIYTDEHRPYVYGDLSRAGEWKSSPKK